MALEADDIRAHFNRHVMSLAALWSNSSHSRPGVHVARSLTFDFKLRNKTAQGLQLNEEAVFAPDYGFIRAAAAIRKSFIRVPKFRRRGGAVAPWRHAVLSQLDDLNEF